MAGGNGREEAIALSFACGLIFAYRFTRPFLAVALEHALYGDPIFTIGLGPFFSRASRTCSAKDAAEAHFA
jgi:hypothetical protein